jgi:hypothetical protein
MKHFTFAIFALFIIVSGPDRVPTLSATTPTIESTPGPTAGPTDYGTVSVLKQIVLRTTDGEPVAGITVQLVAAGPELGGPPTGTAAQQGITDEQGSATFTNLGRWVWMATFSGTFRGRDVQPVGEQARAPWGRTRTGSGFPVMLQRQEEDAPATPVTVNGIAQPELQPSLFVLVPAQDGWAPTLDLALPGDIPEPLFPVLTTVPSATPSAPPGAQVSNGTADQDLSDLAQWLYILPVAVALLASYAAWQGRPARKSGYRQRSTEESRHASKSEQEGAL